MIENRLDIQEKITQMKCIQSRILEISVKEKEKLINQGVQQKISQYMQPNDQVSES